MKLNRRRGRPKGSTYANVDAGLHAMMRLLIADGRVPSLTEAARKVVHLAYGAGTDDSKVRRLVRTYPN